MHALKKQKHTSIYLFKILYSCCYVPTSYDNALYTYIFRYYNGYDKAEDLWTTVVYVYIIYAYLYVWCGFI